jgi:hypothetical protein
MFLKLITKFRYHPSIHFPKRDIPLSGKTVKLTNREALNLAMQE